MVEATKQIVAGPLDKYLRVWEVDLIDEGPVAIEDIWARRGQFILFYRLNDGRICAFAQTGFAFNNYEQFHFEYKNGFLESKNVEPGVHIKVGFQDESYENVFVSFSGKAGEACQYGNGWGGGGGGEP